MLIPTKHDPHYFGNSEVIMPLTLEVDSINFLKSASINHAKIEDKSNHATKLLKEASDIQSERGQEYDQGNAERNIGKVVKAFNAIHGTNLTESMGWHFMALLKAVRLFSTEEFHKDSAVDLVSYASLTGEAKSEGK